MPPESSPTAYVSAAPETRGRRCFRAFLLPPLAVVVFGAGMIALAPDPTIPPSPDQQLAASDVPISRIFTEQVQYWDASILRWAASSSLNPNLVAVVMQIESCGDPSARSAAGALGLFQVMPYHFIRADDPYSPDTNATRGMTYLKRSLATARNDIRLALAGYNGGIALISQPQWLWPAETSRYAYWGSGIYQDAMSGSTVSPRLNEWLASGGASMCSRAGQILHL